MRIVLSSLSAVLAALALAGCAYTPPPAAMTKLPIYPNKTSSTAMLNDLPRAEAPVAVAVYGFNDETGQFKPSNLGQTLSRAVSQGGSAMLVRSLQESGNRGWFTIVEREQLKDLLNERQIIRDMRAQYLGEKGVNPQALPALLFAGVLLEGGVVGYDTNTVTGGVGAAMLGIGGDAKYQQDTVTVYLRAVSVKTGEVLTSVTASKTITSYAVDANVFRYIASDKILETENGFTTNEPGMLALQQAIDKAVYGLIMEGTDLKLWNFADQAAAAPFLQRYHDERDGVMTAQDVIDAEKRERRAAGVTRTPRPAAPAPASRSPSARAAPGAAAVGPAAMNTQHRWTPAVQIHDESAEPIMAPAAISLAEAPPPAAAPAPQLQASAASVPVRGSSDGIGELLTTSNSPPRSPRSGEEPAGLSPPSTR